MVLIQTDRRVRRENKDICGMERCQIGSSRGGWAGEHRFTHTHTHVYIHSYVDSGSYSGSSPFGPAALMLNI